MTVIKIPDYSEMVPGNVYLRSRTITVNRKRVPCSEMLVLNHYFVRGVEGMVDKVLSLGERMPLFRGGIEPEDPEKPIVLALEGLPEGMLERIVDRDSDTIAHLRSHYPDFRYKVGRRYFQINRGVVPNFILDDNRTVLDDVGNIAYLDLLRRVGGDEYVIRIRLELDGSLPKEEEIGYLLRTRVSLSDVIFFNGDYKNFDLAAGVLRSLQNTLDSAGGVSNINDDSEGFLLSVTMATVESFKGCLLARDFLKKLVFWGVLIQKKDMAGIVLLVRKLFKVLYYSNCLWEV